MNRQLYQDDAIKANINKKGGDKMDTQIRCACGGTYIRNKKRHELTQKHQSYELAKLRDSQRRKTYSSTNSVNQMGSTTVESTKAEGFVQCACGGNISKNYPICRHRKTKSHTKYMSEHPDYQIPKE